MNRCSPVILFLFRTLRNLYLICQSGRDAVEWMRQKKCNTTGNSKVRTGKEKNKRTSQESDDERISEISLHAYFRGSICSVACIFATGSTDRSSLGLFSPFHFGLLFVNALTCMSLLLYLCLLSLSATFLSPLFIPWASASTEEQMTGSSNLRQQKEKKCIFLIKTGSIYWSKSQVEYYLCMFMMRNGGRKVKVDCCSLLELPQLKIHRV